MADDAELTLLDHKLQLQQVEAALELDKDNEDLKSLKRDLEEVIKLSMELLGKTSDSQQPKWNVGDQCMAMSTLDKLYYRATILEFFETSCVVKFDAYDTTDVCQICHLKPITTVTAPVNKKRSREIKARAIEKKKEKKVRLQQRQEEIEVSCETAKNQWLNFSKKVLKTGKSKKSIFASPEAPDGRVGVGTCGIGGRPMTKFTMVNNSARKS